MLQWFFFYRWLDQKTPSYRYRSIYLIWNRFIKRRRYRNESKVPDNCRRQPVYDLYSYSRGTPVCIRLYDDAKIKDNSRKCTLRMVNPIKMALYSSMQWRSTWIWPRSRLQSPDRVHIFGLGPLGMDSIAWCWLHPRWCQPMFFFSNVVPQYYLD